jgi:hypothetical protein
MQVRIDRRLLVEFGFVTALIALPAVPLIAWRGSALSYSVWPVAAVFGCWLVVLAAWLATSPTIPAFSAPDRNDAPTTRRFVAPAVAVLLFLLTVLAFGLPLRIHFWGGVDEAFNFRTEEARVWSDEWDRNLGRPLVGLPTSVATHLTPNRIEGFLLVAGFLCFANGCLLCLLIGRLLPRATPVAVTAAVLLTVHRADALRFLVMWASNHYGTVLFLLLLASWLFLLSYARQSRALLVSACIALGCSLLSNESVYPTAALLPVLGVAVRRDWRRYSVWAFAWYGTVAMLAVRFTFQLARGFHSYQGVQLKALVETPVSLFAMLWREVRPIWVYLQPSGPWRGYAGYACAAFALAAAAVLIGRRRWAAERVNLRAAALAGVAVLFGALPFLPAQAQPQATVLRTQFIVAPAEATLLALLIDMAARLLPVRVRVSAVCLAVGLVAANATVAAVQTQERDRSPVRFERTVHLFRQVHGISPSFVPGTLLVFVLEDPERTPIGFNYMLTSLAKSILRVNAEQANYNDPYGMRVAFGADRVTADVFESLDDAATVTNVVGRPVWKFGYDKVVAFRVKADGSATLLRKLPPELLPSPNAGAAYDPLSRMRPGPFAELPYIRYPAWSARAGDVVAPEDGLMLGDGWGPLTAEGDRVYRVLLDGAELVVNSHGAGRRSLALDLEASAGPDGDGATVEIRNASGVVVGSAPLAGRSVVRLDVPVNPERVDVYRVCLKPRPGPASQGRARGTPHVRAFRKADGKRYVPVEQDVFRDGLLPGKGWYALERAGGERFHWVGDDAEIDLRYYPGNSSELALTVEAGPAFGNNPCTLEVRDDSNHVVATRAFRRRQEVRIPVPPGCHDRLRLHVKDGGASAPGDSRVLDYRVYACAAGNP